ncbi:hypothetical protein COCNU_06G000320 [Cocos nucifera]|uniref:Uncharacterized protein n=1 Tax=Cocos nucifera TaxID=13894 RepID=A0A8K0I9J0_COCNU|nr:hypothetical protein COCNU_06G000320 [Cocos nucifera]
MTEAKIGHLKEALEKAKAKKTKAKIDGALEKKRRRVVEAKITEAEMKVEEEIAEARCLAVEAFKAFVEFTKIKIEFGGEAFKAQQEVCR